MYFKENNEFLEMLKARSLCHIFESALRPGVFRGRPSAVTGIWNRDIQTTAQLHTGLQDQDRKPIKVQS